MIDVGFFENIFTVFLLLILGIGVIGFIPSLFIRYVLFKKPMKNKTAALFSLVVLGVNCIVFNVISSIIAGSTFTHFGILVAVSVVSFFILRKKNKNVMEDM